MALPPKGDPRRPMHLAIRSMRLLGVILILLSLLGMLPLFFIPAARPGVSKILMIFFFGALLIYLIPGVLFLIFSIFLKRRQAWAIIGGIVLSSILLLIAVIALAGVLVNFATVGHTPAALIGLVMSVLFVAAFTQLIIHLSQSFKALKYFPVDEQRGFEVAPVAPIVPSVVRDPSSQS